MAAVRAIRTVAVVLVGILLSVGHAALAQSLFEANDLNQQVIQLYNQGRYSEATPLAQRTLTIREKALGPDHSEVAAALNNLAELYRVQGRYADAESLHKRALTIREQALGPDHPDVALSLNNLAGIYQAQGRYADAEPLYKRSLAIREKALGPDHPDVAQALNNLAGIYQAQGRYADAEPLYKRSLAILEKALGPDHPNVARVGEQSGFALRSPRALRRCGAVVQAIVGDTGKSAWSRSSRCCASAEQSRWDLHKRKVVMPMRSRSTSDHWRYGKKPSVPIIPMLRKR